METALDSSPRDLDQNDLETDLSVALVTGASGLQETRQILLKGVLGLHVMETETLVLHAMAINAQSLLSIGVLDLHAMETGTLLTKVPIDLSKATAFSTMMCQSRYLTRALQANGYMVSTPSWQLCAATDAKFTN